MTFTIRMGVPEMAAFNDELTEKARAGTLGSDEKALFKQWRKALWHLSQNPRHPGLRTHEIDPLSERFGQKVFQSYLNQGATADRFYRPPRRAGCTGQSVVRSRSWGWSRTRRTGSEEGTSGRRCLTCGRRPRSDYHLDREGPHQVIT